MLLQELLDSKVNYEVVKETARTFTTRAKIGTRFITFNAVDDGEQGWDIVFYESDDDMSPVKTFKMTASGDELKVFSMVKASFEEFLGRYTPTRITFTADKESDKDNRAKLYRRLIDKYLKGWTRSEFDHGNTTHFTYEKDEDETH